MWVQTIGFVQEGWDLCTHPSREASKSQAGSPSQSWPGGHMSYVPGEHHSHNRICIIKVLHTGEAGGVAGEGKDHTSSTMWGAQKATNMHR